MKPIIIGGGLAGLSAALSLAPMPVLLLNPGKLGFRCNSVWAQGGIAAAVGPDDDPVFHAEDTLKAGAGLCDPDIARLVTQAAPDAIHWLEQQGVFFDRDASNGLALGLEAAHSRRRIVHAGGDTSGAVIMAALVQAVRRTPSIEVIEDEVAAFIHAENNQVRGLTTISRSMGEEIGRAANIIVLATGGVGAMWQDTTNPVNAGGKGLALALQAGAVMADMEFMQFHPTAIAAGQAHGSMPLASEALRGEGCTLIDETGSRFTEELQPRDIVARAIATHLASGHQVFLDARTAFGSSFGHRFPGIDALCKTNGIDPAVQPIHVRPAAHYHMGGIATDADGRSSVEGLWACGEVACTGLHGANRLASNSLLEAVVFGQRVAADIAGKAPAPPSSGKPLSPAGSFPDDGQAMQEVMSQCLGLLRDENGLLAALRRFYPSAEGPPISSVGLMMALFALMRKESRGAHARSDYPEMDKKGLRSMMTLAQGMDAAQNFLSY